MSRPFRGCALIMTACLLSSATAHAEPPPSAPRPPPSHTWGAIVIATSIVAGAALTGYGLTIDCGDHDHACHRRAALPIWSGVGVAAAGSIVGLQLLRF